MLHIFNLDKKWCNMTKSTFEKALIHHNPCGWCGSLECASCSVDIFKALRIANEEFEKDIEKSISWWRKCIINKPDKKYIEILEAMIFSMEKALKIHRKHFGGKDGA